MTLAYMLIWGSWVAFGLSAVWALVWAINHGQFQDPEEASKSIFDDEEPIGQMTDCFPGEELPP
jgi:cbb3-type cytochrome oxidase maturation protein